MVQKRVSQTLTFLMLALALSFTANLTPAFGIGFLVAANPAMGQQLKAAPQSVSLEFSVKSIPDSLSGNVIRVTNSSGKPVESGAVRTVGTTMSIGLQDGLQPDKYQVAFRYVCDDGHVLVSAYSFSIANPVIVDPAPSSKPEPSIAPKPEVKPVSDKPQQVSSSSAPAPTTTSNPSLKPEEAQPQVSESSAAGPSNDSHSVTSTSTQPTGIIWIIFLVAGLIATVVLFQIWRRRRMK
jgi:methionine-rich copper-binding protein CopC